MLEVRPAFGPSTGGTKILILGYGFWGASGVTIGGVPATDFRYIDAATVEAVTPPGAVGWQPVVVTLAVGRATATFKYEEPTAPAPAAPVVTAPPVTPAAAATLTAPTGVAAKSSKGVVTVTWRHKGAIGAHKEVVTVYSGGKAVKTVTIPRGATRVTVRGLTKGKAYSFAVTLMANGKRLTSVTTKPVRLIG